MSFKSDDILEIYSHLNELEWGNKPKMKTEPDLRLKSLQESINRNKPTNDDSKSSISKSTTGRKSSEC